MSTTFTSTPIDQWPPATTAATYLGASEHRQRHQHLGTQVTALVVQDWERADGATVASCWSMPDMNVDLDDIVAHFPGRDAYIHEADSMWAIHELEVSAAPADREDRKAMVKWSAVAGALGRALPFWPRSLRRPELIMDWQPGDGTVQYIPTSPNVDETVFLRMAMLYPAGHAVHRTLINLVQARNADPSDADINILQDRLAEGSVSSAHIHLAADLAPTPTVERDELPEPVRRDGWRQILHRSDRLAVECVRNTAETGVRADFSHMHTIKIGRSKPGEEFLSRLEPSDFRAAFVLLGPDPDDTLWVDPLTDTPVVVDARGKGSALAPYRLPSFSPLAELILDGDMWVRTRDGTLYPAPHDDFDGLGWGYRGSGPATLAALAARLLDDITAPGGGLGPNEQHPPGLQQLMEHPWPSGTVLTRAQLEDARN